MFDVGVSVISRHLKNIFDDNELNRKPVVSKMEITENYDTEVYSLDTIIAVE